jgi:general secretion pathway protein G
MDTVVGGCMVHLLQIAQSYKSPSEVPMLARARRTTGFTLVEILIVVIILGILAAIVIPQFTNASQDARESSLLSQLQTLRSQIELYKLQHKDKLPDLVTNWNPMTTKTNIDGGAVAPLDYGPYMQSAPTNPVNTLSNVTNGDSALAGASADCGFIYDYNAGAGTGRIWGTATDKRTKFPE